MASFKVISKILASQPFTHSGQVRLPNTERWNSGIGANFSFCFDSKNSTCIHVDSAITDILGYRTEMLEEEGISLLDKITHKEDIHGVVNLLQRGWGLILSQPADYRQSFNMSIDYRIKSSDGNYLQFIQHFNKLATDNAGNIVYSNCTFHDITHWQKHTLPVLNVYFNNKLLKRWQYLSIDKRSVISRREQEIVQHICSGKTSLEVADILSISKYTVDAHRKSIMKKLGVKGIPALISVASKYQIL